MIHAGFDVTPTDGSPGLAREAENRLRRPIKIMRFEDLDEQAMYDGVWANACLLHVPAERLGDVLAKVYAALRHGGRFYASYKMGEARRRPRRPRPLLQLSVAREADGDLAAGGRIGEVLRSRMVQSGGFDGVPRTFLHVTVIKA